jgi:uncharacterized protein with NRDE domain
MDSIEEDIMCLILIAFRTHPQYPLILAANRDEFYDRPTAPASFWETKPRILAGKDLKSGGTWLGISRKGRIAALSNFRDPRSVKDDSPSRGSLVTKFLLGAFPAAEYLEAMQQHAEDYNGFSMIFGDWQQLYIYSNKGAIAPRLQPGIHGLSNHLLDTPWPKVVHGKNALATVLAKGGEPPVEELFALLADSSMPADNLLPDTGIGLEWERLLAPLFISGPTYGTRSSTVLMIDQDAIASFFERTYNGGNPGKGTTLRYRFRIEP